MTATRFADHILGPDTHANRPAATACPWGTVYKCTTHNMIEKNDGGTWVDWASLAGGFSDPLTTKGDLLVRSASASTRQAAGADGTSLVYDAAQTNGVKAENRVKSIVAGTNVTVDSTDPLNPIVAASGGGGSAFPLDSGSLNGTYGDHFTGSSLDAKWTRVGYVSGDEQYQTGGGSWLQIDTARTAANYYYQTAPSGDFTVVMKMTLWSNTGVMFGPLILDSSGNGICAAAYNSSDGHYALAVSAGSYGGSFTTVAGPVFAAAASGRTSWLKLNKTSTNYKASISLDGATWRAWTSTKSFATTPTRIGFGGITGTALSFAVDWFDVQ
jgi:hypothetical protein